LVFPNHGHVIAGDVFPPRPFNPDSLGSFPQAAGSFSALNPLLRHRTCFVPGLCLERGTTVPEGGHALHVSLRKNFPLAIFLLFRRVVGVAIRPPLPPDIWSFSPVPGQQREVPVFSFPPRSVPLPLGRLFPHVFPPLRQIVSLSRLLFSPPLLFSIQNSLFCIFFSLSAY